MRYISGTRAVNQAKGREAQKARTRTLIVAAAGGLTQPTVEQAADAAGVSRATAYRYFPTQEALSVELESGDVWREVEALVNDPQTADVGARLDRLIDAVVRTVYAEERHVRTALRVYHDIWLRNPDSPVRKGRRMDWIDKTISPVPAEARENLRLALALAISPDAVTMLKDVARLDAEQTRRVLKGAARAMLRAAEQLDGKSEEASPQAG
jgi:AcrR family transcriptional regulator